MAVVLCLTLVVGLVVVRPTAASADPGPADSASHAAQLAGGWLARQVTAGGVAIGSDPLSDLAPTLWAGLGLIGVGVGRAAVDRIVQRLPDRLADRGLGDLSMTELALAIQVLQLSDLDPRAVGPTALDLVGAMLGRRTDSGVDAGLIGSPNPLTRPVVGHSLALAALATVGEPVPDSSRAWLVDQQCPNGGWPDYRDAAARSTGTCELLPSGMTPTSLALQAMAVLAQQPTTDAEPFLRAARDQSGGFAEAPGLRPTPAATARGVMAVVASTGASPDESWMGASGLPTEVLQAEQLGCGWHGADRGAIPASAHDTVPDDPDAPEGDPDPDGPSTAPPGMAAPVAAVAMAALALQGQTLPLDPPPSQVGDPFPDCPVTRRRLAGSGRVETSITLSATAFPDGAPAAVLATARDYADALAATALAGHLGGPILLSWPDRAGSLVLDELRRLEPEQVVLMGGTAALSAEVARDVAALEGVTVRRVAGSTRAETAVAAADEVGGPVAFLARGMGPADAAPWADALSVGAWAAARGIPVLLTGRDDLPTATVEALSSRDRIIIIGGRGAVSDAVQDRVQESVQTVDRISGPTRVATSAAVVRTAFADGVDARTVVMATARDYPDALAAGVAAAAMGGTLLMVDPDGGIAESATREALLDLDYLVDQVILAGGNALLPDDIGQQAADLVRQGSEG